MQTDLLPTEQVMDAVHKHEPPEGVCCKQRLSERSIIFFINEKKLYYSRRLQETARQRTGAPAENYDWGGTW